MPMNDTALAGEIRTALEAVVGPLSGDDVDACLQALSGAIIDHIIANAVTQVVISSGSSAGTYNGSVIS